MAISEAVLDYRKSSNLSQGDIAKQVNVDRTLITKAENGMKLAEHHDAALSKVNWRIALTVIDERSGGYISNILDEQPNLDLHPAALSQLLEKDLKEALQTLGDITLANHIDPKKQKEQAERTYLEIKDVVDKGAIMQGVLEEMFGLDRERLQKRYEMEVREGKR
jgi:transcriptional regulator with XRE-family HTH domain